MKIYEIGTGYTPIPAQMGAATEIVVEELTKAFLKKGVPVEIIDIATENRSETDLPILEVKVPNRFSQTDVQLGLMHKLKRVVYSIALANTLRKILKKTSEPVVLHFHNQYNLFFFMKLVSKRLRKKCMIAYTNHSGIWRQEWEKIKGTIQKRYFQEAECMKKADVLFLLNSETKQNAIIRLGVERSKIFIVNNGVNIDKYAPLSEEQKSAARETFGLRDCCVILQVGSVYENKGQLRSLEMLRPMLEEKPNIVFAYAGGIVDQEYQEKIVEYAQRCGLEKQVRYLGMVKPGKELNMLYNAAKMTVMPSIYEAFGMVAIESLSAGVPVLIDRASCFRFGDGVALYDNTDLSAAIEVVLATHEEMKFAARRNALAVYSWDKIAEAYLDVFTKEQK